MGKISKIVINQNGQSIEYDLGSENTSPSNTYTKDEIDQMIKISIEQLANTVGGDA